MGRVEEAVEQYIKGGFVKGMEGVANNERLR